MEIWFNVRGENFEGDLRGVLFFKTDVPRMCCQEVVEADTMVMFEAFRQPHKQAGYRI